MATYSSYQVTDIDATAPQKLQPSELGGRVRVAYGRFTTPSAGLPVGDIVRMVKVPKGARLVAIFHAFAGMSSGAGVAGADIGDSDNPTRFATAVNLDTGGSGFAPINQDTTAGLREPALGQGYIFPQETAITYRVTGEAWAGNKTINVVAFYAVD